VAEKSTVPKVFHSRHFYVRPALEEAFAEHYTDFSDLTIETEAGISKKLSEVAIEAVSPKRFHRVEIKKQLAALDIPLETLHSALSYNAQTVPPNPVASQEIGLSQEA
jgi:hypothetical protein